MVLMMISMLLILAMLLQSVADQQLVQVIRVPYLDKCLKSLEKESNDDNPGSSIYSWGKKIEV